MTRLLRLLAPRYRVHAVTDLSPRRLRAWQIDALMLDVDNTLVQWGGEAPPRGIRDWMDELHRSGIPACLVSNNISDRVRRVASLLGLPYAQGRFKPSAAKLRHALAILGSPPERTAMVGDQILTDILAGNRLGVPTVLTSPLAPHEPIRMKLMRPFERRVLAALVRRGLVATLPEV